jgi:hypothetical protein
LIRRVAFAISACALLAGGQSLFLHRLSSEQVREAYFIGRDADKRQSLFSHYIHYPAQPDRGPDIHLIEFRTPFEQVALKSQERWTNYDPLDAEHDYDTQPQEVVIRVFICGSQTFSFASPPSNDAPWRLEDYLRGFEFHVSQTHPLKPQKLTEQRALFGCADFDGFEAFLHFDPEQFAPESVKIEVIAPGGENIHTEFDLDVLK